MSATDHVTLVARWIWQRRDSTLHWSWTRFTEDEAGRPRLTQREAWQASPISSPWTC